MSLRARLSLAFLAVVLVPLLLAGAIVARAVPGLRSSVSGAQVVAAARGAAEVLGQRCVLAQSAAQSVAWESVAATPQRAVADAVGAGSALRASYAAVVGPSGSVRASAGTFPAGVSSPRALAGCRDGPGGTASAVVAQVPLISAAGARTGTAVVALPLDRALLSRLADVAGGQVVLASGGRVVSSTLPAGAAARLLRAVSGKSPERATTVDGHLVATVPPAAGRTVSVVVRSAEDANPTGLAPTIGAIVVAILVLAGAIAWVLSRLSTKPLADLAQAADRVAKGQLDTHIPVGSADEVGQLAVAFNEMTDDLRTYVEALERSRDELRTNLARLGETLSSTHDLNRILTVILETAMASAHAVGGVLLMGATGRHDLYVKIVRGLDEYGTGERLRTGEGVLGTVAATGEAVRGRVDASGAFVPAPVVPAVSAPTPTSGEPLRAIIAVPLMRSGRVLGVMGLYDRPDAADFDAADLETIRTFAAQATVAIDNVLLHQEAQRLSITDGLTGLWNYRYFTMNFGKEIERAARFGRPLAVLLLDLDKFKVVNDAHGHQRGDSVLIELATRVSSEIREVDTFARYGGEEFVLVLPETDADGACQAAERVCDVVRSRPFGHDTEEPLRVTVSVGVAVFPQHGTTAAALVKAADTALYDAKEGGRNGWRMASGALTPGLGD